LCREKGAAGALAESLTVNPPLNNQFSLINNNIAPGETNSLFRDAANSNAAFLNAFSAGETFSQIKNQIPGFSPPAFVSPGRKTLSPQYQKWSLEMQQVFGANTSVTIGYFGNHGIHELIQNTSAKPMVLAVCLRQNAPARRFHLARIRALAQSTA
jgi:hypothetical protein